ncbi:FHIP family protein CPIJ015043-like isoform X2 [Homarus americanus]|uniref:FHIP family protein CPIJ015043-like isoform X2 n=1 Tax=Homarus americanus TaxID=6706 RepID=UPI001C484AB4|nr:FHIP family protein CPIJ015043-like isoform X2 [Homarus americanus]
MNSWLRESPLRVSLGRRRVPSPLHDVDPAAAFQSFIKHWQQTREIINRTQLRGQVFADDVTAVINHLAQMVTLLLVDLKQIMAHGARTHNGIAQRSRGGNSSELNTTGNPLEGIQEFSNSHHSSLPAENPPHTPIFDHFLGEEILDTILTWSLSTGEFVNAMKLEQLKVHEQLLSHARQEILVYKPIIRPLLRLLAACGGCVPVDVEKRLVVLLNQLCVSLMHNHHLLDFFFQFSSDQGPTKFVIFSLLLPFVHREGGIGQQARDALLLCMALSSSHTSVGQYIAQHSNFCPVLAAGLSGLYSMLPRSLAVESDGWHRLSMEDIVDIPQLQLFLNSLEFCNAVVQVAHPLVRKQLVEFLYQGFLVPVLGPALHQGDAVNGDVQAHNTTVFLSVVGEVVAATTYVELCLRTVTEPELRRVFLAFLLTSPNNPAVEPPIITILISRLHTPNTQLCLVTLSLFWTLVELNCEDLMVALVFQYLTPCTHVMLSQRSRLTQPPNPAAKSSHKLVHLIPEVCQVESCQMESETLEASNAQQSSSIPQSSPVIIAVPRHQRSLSNASTCSSESDSIFLDQPTTYSQYLKEAQMRIAGSIAACAHWTWRYDGLHPSPSQAVEMLNTARVNPPMLYAKLRAHSDPTPIKSTDLTQADSKIRSSSFPSDDRTSKSEVKPVLNGICDCENNISRSAQPGALGGRGVTGQNGDEDNLDSLGESSGYESFNIRASRDSSPVDSSHGSPRNQLIHQGPIQSYSRERQGSGMVSEEDQEFIDSLQRSSTPTELTGLEETISEIDQAFTAFKIYDVSPSKSYNKVYQLEIMGEEGDWDSPPWLGHDSSPEVVEKASAPESQSRPTIGPFLEALMLRIDQMLSSSIHVNLLVTTILSHLASYPTPLLSSLLLDTSIVFQPSVRSLVQVVSGLKQRIDGVLTTEDVTHLSEARSWFVMRLIVPRYSPSTPRTRSVSSSSTETPLIRGEGKRRSISQTMSALFRRNTNIERPAIKENPLEDLPDKSGYRYVKRASVASVGPNASSGSVAEKRHAARCAVLLQDWLLELSALAQEQMVAVPSLTFRIPSS